MSEHRGVPGVAGDVRAVKCAHLVLEHEESERRGVTGVAGDEARATNSLVNWSNRLVHGLCCRLVDRTVRRSLLLNAHFAAGHLTGLLNARTSPAMPRTPWCLNIASYARDSSVLEHHHLRRGLLGARTSPATPGTPRSSVLGHRRLRRGLLAPRFSMLGHR